MKEPTGNSDRVLLITGASRGIGKHLVEHYLVKGYRVVGCSRGASRLEHENYQHFQSDVSDEAGVKKMFAEITRTYGRLDVLINNAGVASMNHILLTPLKVARNIMETNFIGTFLLCREAARLMKRHGFGRIVNLASVAVPLKLEGEAVYAASKAAVISFTQIIAKELATFGITVNAVGPTPIQTDLIKGVPQEKIEMLVRSQAIQRPGELRDVANVIDFFIQPESDFITGQVVFLGGV
ncbi:MAG: 3-oxoacyl-[acyl-carrier protein] reductase [Acidobacteriota bacterium]|jgi:3-oxoacyl-[acyl-carrier protein] reductase|nr:3-oxoacyl-[acyl-carrier protein] reductase [Acidobacteriota bacterium]